MSQSQTISISTNGGAFDAYLARPAQVGPAPGVVVIQEIFGVNPNIKGVADW
ncbi:MAG: dienelactone hydrolase family protein, partial [Pseudomonadota bacterium]|nr:dienelactone hydrolase family protein [Pseudomonadota bacterium]